MATVPSIADTDRILDATATAGQDTFGVSWPVIADSQALAVNDLVVTVDEVVIDQADYAFVGNSIVGLSGVMAGIWNGGSVILDDALAGGERVVIYSNRTPRRTGYFLEGKALPMTELDKMMDDIVVQVRDLDLQIKRAPLITVQQYIDGVDPNYIALAALAAATNAVALAQAALDAIVAAGLSGARNYTAAVVTISTAISSAVETYFVNASVPNTQTLPASPTIAEKHVIKDMGGNASTNTITIAGNGKTINGQTNWYIDADSGSVVVQYNGTEWSVLT